MVNKPSSSSGTNRNMHPLVSLVLASCIASTILILLLLFVLPNNYVSPFQHFARPLPVAGPQNVMGVAPQIGEEISPGNSEWAALGRFREWAKKHGKVYASPSEQAARFANFIRTLDQIEAHKNLKSTYTLGLNQFSDMSDEEFAKVVLMSATFKPNCALNVTMSLRGDQRTFRGEVPDRMDWREQGIIGPVKDQGHCGSCWSFSTTGAIEAVSFLLDCQTAFAFPDTHDNLCTSTGPKPLASVYP